MILENYCFGEVLVRDSLVFHLVSSLFFSTERQTALKNDFERVLSRYNDADFDTKRRDVKSGGTKKKVSTSTSMSSNSVIVPNFLNIKTPARHESYNSTAFKSVATDISSNN